MRLLLLSSLVLLPLTACEIEPDCDTMAAASVQLTLVDPDGDPPPEQYARYSVDEGESWTSCDELNGEWVCGWEAAGELRLIAGAWGYEEVEDRVVVEEDECHVITEVLEYTLQPVDCTAEEVPSVLVTVTDEAGTTLPDAEVRWYYAYLDGMPIDCEKLGEQWACGWEEPGELDIFASAPGHQQVIEMVTVEEDECHVITEELTLALPAI